jgi:hypothetical protein
MAIFVKKAVAWPPRAPNSVTTKAMEHQHQKRKEHPSKYLEAIIDDS